MSHDDIRAALESRTDLPWRPSHDGPVATRPSDTYDVYDCDGDVIAASLFYLDAHLIAHAPTWLAELLAEVDRLTALTSPRKVEAMASLVKASTRLVQIERDDARARAEAAEQAIQRVRAMPAGAPSGGYYMVSMREVLRALDGAS